MKKPWTDKEALKVYKLATGDNPWDNVRDADDRKYIAEEMRNIATAKTVKDAAAVIEWWCNSEENTLATVKAVRKAWKERKNG